MPTRRPSSGLVRTKAASPNKPIFGRFRDRIQEIDPEGNMRELSTLSLSEIAIKGAKGKLGFSKDDVMLWVADLKLRVLPYTAEHARRLFDLPLYHTDPFDRQIIAQALTENIPVVTSDEAVRLYPGIRVIW